MPSFAPSVAAVLSIGRTSAGAEGIHPRGGERLASAPSRRTALESLARLQWSRDGVTSTPGSQGVGKRAATSSCARSTVNGRRVRGRDVGGATCSSSAALSCCSRSPQRGSQRPNDVEALDRTTSFVRRSRAVAHISEEHGRERSLTSGSTVGAWRAQRLRDRVFTTSPHRRSTIFGDLQPGSLPGGA